MNERPKQIPVKRRRWPRILLAVLVVFATLYAGYRYTLHRMVEAKLDEIRKQGYPVTLAELDKCYPQVPAGENAADVYLEAFKHLPGRHNSDTNLPIVGDAELPPRTAPMPPEMQQAVERYLAANREVLDLLHEAAAKRACRYPLNMLDADMAIKSKMIIFSPIRRIRQGARLLDLDALSASAVGDPQRATDAVASSLALAQSLGDRSLPVSYAAGQTCLRLTISSLEQALNRTAFTEQQLVELSAAFRKVETEDAFTRAIIGERALANEQWKEIRDGKVSVQEEMVHLPGPGDTGEKFDPEIAAIYRRSGLVDLDYLVYLGFLRGLIESSSVPFPTRFERIDSLTRNAQKWRLHPLARMEAYLWGYLARRDARFIAQLRVVCTVIAVERYRLANGTVPDSSSVLAPQFLAAVPTDPFDGQPLRYKKLGKGYVVYSVGEDGKDDGGDEKKDITFTVER
jgi:hypothetical protein